MLQKLKEEREFKEKKNIDITTAIANTMRAPCKVSLPVGQVTLKASCLTS